MQVGFTVICKDQEVEFRFLGRRLDDPRSLVSLCQCADHTAVLMGRLDYRREFLAKLGPQLPAELARECATNDAALALAAYRCQGRDGVARLEGDYSLVIWDGRQQRLLGSRDPLGGYPLFWTQAGGSFALGTSLQALLSQLPGRSLDRDYLAEFMVLPVRSMLETADERTVYEGAQRVLAGTMLEFRLPAGTIERHRYWDWSERQADPGTDRLEEIGARFGELFRDSVRERMRGRTAAHLSGGMDSTSVALVARNCLAARPGAAPLDTLSLEYHELPCLAREKPYLESVLAEQNGMAAHRVAADNLLDFDSFQWAPLHDEPCPWLWSQAPEMALLDRAEQVGAQSVLSGHGADGLLEMMPYYLTGMLRRGRVLGAWREACRWAAAANCSPWKFLGPFGLDNLLPAWARAGVMTMFRGGYAAWNRQTQWTIAPWILPNFARQHQLRRRTLANIRRVFSSCRPVELSLAVHAISESANDFTRWHLAAPRGIHLAHPFLDPRVLSFCLGTQTRLRREPTQQKPVLAEAMRDVLPERIGRRPRKGNFNEVYFRGLAKNHSALEELIHRSRVEDLELLDKNILLDCLHRGALGTADAMLGLSRLNHTLSLLKWLALQEEQRQVGTAPMQITPATVALVFPAANRPRQFQRQTTS
jgi:asparagine synthase (glutamine-hydrolysing)